MGDKLGEYDSQGKSWTCCWHSLVEQSAPAVAFAWKGLAPTATLGLCSSGLCLTDNNQFCLLVSTNAVQNHNIAAAKGNNVLDTRCSQLLTSPSVDSHPTINSEEVELTFIGKDDSWPVMGLLASHSSYPVKMVDTVLSSQGHPTGWLISPDTGSLKSSHDCFCWCGDLTLLMSWWGTCCTNVEFGGAGLLQGSSILIFYVLYDRTSGQSG